MCEELHDPFADQVACARYRAERDALAQRMEEVASEIDRTLSGVEGIEDAPAMRWMRGLREALGALHSPRTSYEDIEAARWVREHGGLDHVREEWRSRVPYDRYERTRQNLLRHIAECETALGRRNWRIEELEGRIKALTTENAELRKRAMPEDCEWPRYTSGELVEVGDDVVGPDYGERIHVDAVKFHANGFTLYDKNGFDMWYESDERFERPAALAADGEPLEVRQTVWGTKGGSYHLTSVHDGEVFARHIGGSFGAEVESAGGSGLYRLRAEQLTHQRPAPKVLDADGVEIREGDTVWRADNGKEYWVRKGHQMTADAVVIGLKTNNDCADETVDASVLTHRAPVLAADGKPLREGEHVYHVETGAELVVKELPKPGEYQAVVVFALPTSPASHLTSFDPDRLTHERPDSWERLEEDAEKDPCGYFGFDGEEPCGKCPASGKGCEQTMALDIVRRAKALAERDA